MAYKNTTQYLKLPWWDPDDTPTLEDFLYMIGILDTVAQPLKIKNEYHASLSALQSAYPDGDGEWAHVAGAGIYRYAGGAWRSIGIDLSAYYTNVQVDSLLGGFYTKTQTDDLLESVSGLPLGGTTGQLLGKNSNTDGDASWVTLLTQLLTGTTQAGSLSNIAATDSIAQAYGKLMKWYMDGAAGILQYSTAVDVRGALGLSYLTANVTYYVATTGNDTTGTGASGTPFATINKALSLIPKNLNGFTATINIADGSHTANSWLVRGFYGGGRIVINGNTTTPSNVSVGYNNVLDSYVVIEIRGATFTQNTGWNTLTYNQNCPQIWYRNCVFNGQSQTLDGVATFGGARVKVTDCTFTNCKSCVATIGGAQTDREWSGDQITFGSCSGSGNAVGAAVTAGEIKKINSTLPTATTAHTYANAGTITMPSGGVIGT